MTLKFAIDAGKNDTAPLHSPFPSRTVGSQQSSTCGHALAGVEALELDAGLNFEVNGVERRQKIRTDEAVNG